MAVSINSLAERPSGQTRAARNSKQTVLRKLGGFMVANFTNHGTRARCQALILSLAFAGGGCSSNGAATPPQTANDSGGGSGGSSGDAGGDAADAGVATHSGLLSIQDMAIHGLPQLGHGLTVQIVFTPARPPDYEELPGQLTGCKAWVYDVTKAPPPVPSDQGTVTIAGIAGGSIECRFEPSIGYVCPTWTGSGKTSVTPGAPGTAEYAIEGAAFTDADVGRYLQITAGGGTPAAYPILRAPSANSVSVLNPAATAQTFTGSFRVLAGAGPVPDNPRDPIRGEDQITVGIVPGGEGAFDFPDIGPITPGGEFVLNDASRAVLDQLPLDGRAITLSCAGSGGECAAAQATVVRLSTTDGSTAGASPTAMPAPTRSQIEIQCGTLGGDGSLTVPAEAMALLQSSHAASPITRIRVAYMREGLGIAANPPGLSPNGVRALVGHGVLAFVNP
jgi:hypothetical protein